MKRLLEKHLKDWKERADRKPLLVRGARQIGKTYLIEKFGNENFDSIVTINFEEMREAKLSFEGDLSPIYLLRDLSTRLKKSIIPGKTLLFFDEIQACPNALLSLRFFKEQMPELHIIGAGSLLEFIMTNEQFSFPVGRIEYLFMRPLSFVEFLEAKGEDPSVSWIAEATPQNPIGASTHASLIRSVKEYFAIGGMPEAIVSVLNSGLYLDLDRIHHDLLNTYENDFGKYPKSSQQKFMKLLFEKAPSLIADHFKYAKIHPYAQSRDYLESLDVLSRTGLLHQVFANTASGIPLEFERNDKKFKLLFLDIGLVPQASLALTSTEDITVINGGALAEQFVGQELIAYAQPYTRAILYYWERDKKGSDAEVDYIIEIGPHIIPIEVKAGTKGSLRSLKQFMEEKKSILGLRISQAPLALEGNVLSVPFYMVKEIPRLVLDSISKLQQHTSKTKGHSKAQ